MQSSRFRSILRSGFRLKRFSSHQIRPSQPQSQAFVRTFHSSNFNLEQNTTSSTNNNSNDAQSSKQPQQESQQSQQKTHGSKKSQSKEEKKKWFQLTDSQKLLSRDIMLFIVGVCFLGRYYWSVRRIIFKFYFIKQLFLTFTC